MWGIFRLFHIRIFVTGKNPYVRVLTVPPLRHSLFYKTHALFYSFIGSNITITDVGHAWFSTMEYLEPGSYIPAAFIFLKV